VQVAINGPVLGTLVVSIFGGVWCLYGAWGLQPRARALPIVAALTISTALVLSAVHTRAVTHQFVLSVYLYSLVFEVVAIVVIARVLRRSGRTTLIGPVIAVIVGLHFIGLWLATGDSIFIGLTIALCAVGLCAMRLRPSVRIAAAGFGSALVLWGSGLIMILR
jgi:glucan phosphoethanolaminetransferase (alkaline phosphatase superfamily)